MTTETPAPAEALSREQLEALRGHTPAPWAWRGYPTHRDSVPKHPYLRSEVSPRYIVMDFVRQGMQGAQPRLLHRNTGPGIMRPVSEMGAGWAAHPDARLIAAAPDLLTTALAALARAEVAEAEVKRLREALTPTVHTKAAFMGEFFFGIELPGEDGEGEVHRVMVPWTTVKEIMAAISARAALAGSPS